MSGLTHKYSVGDARTLSGHNLADLTTLISGAAKAITVTDFVANFTLTSGMNGQVFRNNTGSNLVVTCPNMSAGFSATFVQSSTGTIQFTASGAASVNNISAQTRTNAQWSVVTLLTSADNQYILMGNTAA